MVAIDRSLFSETTSVGTKGELHLQLSVLFPEIQKIQQKSIKRDRNRGNKNRAGFISLNTI